ncbi:acetyl-CoA carboxylase carboxyltransferase subunit beta [bacterium]|nr:acetyl-CoA carboxylase carboxyltransferase subunit beta [bacterium]
MWFKIKKKPQQIITDKRLQIPEGLWLRCKSCKEIIYSKEVERNCDICPKCGYHFPISAAKRLNLLYDNGTFEEFDTNIRPDDPLKFKDRKKYKDRLKEYREETGLFDAVISSQGQIGGYTATVCAMDFGFMGGSMASVVGEKITRGIERAIRDHTPFLSISASGGARMQEGMISLMQMAKTSAALTHLSDAKLPYISILTDPTTGGVTASFAMLGDIIIAEPKALIGFAGPRVIEQTIGQQLPYGFQTSEFLLEHGMIDMICTRKELKQVLVRLFVFFNQK